MRRLELFLDAKAANTPPRGISKASRVIFSVLTLLFLSIGQVWGADVINNSATSSDLGDVGTTNWYGGSAANTFSISGASGASYSIASMGTKNTSLALKWNGNAYLYQTTSGGKLKSVTVVGTSGKSVKIFAANSAYSAKATGTEISTLNLTGSAATYTFTSDYTYLAINGNASSTEITSITVEYKTGGTVNLTGLALSPSVLYVGKGESATITPVYTPSDASNKNVTWVSGNTSIATVASNGVVTANNSTTGNATITCTSSADNTISAVCSVVVAEGDKLTASAINSSSYSDWSGKKGTGNVAVYAGNSMGGSTKIQMRSTNSSGIVSTTSAGNIKSVSIVWKDGETNDNRTIDIYGNNTAYTSAANLYSNTASVKGKKIGSIAYPATSCVLDLSEGDYKYVGIRSNSGALYLASVTFFWEALPTYAVTLEAEGCSLDVQKDATSISSGDEFEAGQALTVSYSANTGYENASLKIKKASDNSDVTGAVLSGSTITVPDYAIKVVATATKKKYTVTLSATNGHITVGGNTETSIDVAHGETAQLTAVADDDYNFNGWTSSDGTKVALSGANDNPVTITVTGAATVTASFISSALNDPELSWSSNTATVVKGQTPYSLPSLTNEHGLTIAYESSNTSVAEIAANGAVTIKGVGETTITASNEEQGGYAESSKSYTLTVKGRVIWHAKKADFDATTYADYVKDAVPTKPTGDFIASCHSSISLVGWTTEDYKDYSDDDDAPAEFYTASEDMPGVTDNVDYYAVWGVVEEGGWNEITSVANLTAGTYAICSDHYFMKAVKVDNKNRLQNGGEPSISEGKLTSDPAADCQWTISKNGEGKYLFQNEDKYAIATSTKNEMILSNADDIAEDAHAQWEIARSGSIFEVTNIGRDGDSDTPANKYLRNNTTSGWACYSINQGGEGYAPRFFKYSAGSTTGYTTNCVEPMTVATPTFTPNGSAAYYTEAQNVTISCTTEGSVIYYTLDNTTPSKTNGTLYSTPINVAETKTIKAIAYVGDVASEVATATFTLSLSTMDQIYAAATAIGGTAQERVITFNNWVVSGVKDATAYVTDGEKGFIIYTTATGNHGLAVNDKISGTVTCQLKLYNKAAQVVGLAKSDITTAGGSVTNDGLITPIAKTIASLGGVNTGAPVIISNVTYNSSNQTLVDGDENAIKPYTTLFNYGSTFENNKIYTVTGIYLQYGESTKEILPRKAEDIVLESKEQPTLKWYVSNTKETEIGASYTINADAEFAPYFESNSEGAKTYSSTVGTVASINPSTGALTIEGVGETVIACAVEADGDYLAGSKSFTLRVRAAGSGDASWVASEWATAASVSSGAKMADNSPIAIDANISMTWAKANSSSDPIYHSEGTAARLYQKNTLTFTASNSKQITRIVFHFSGTYTGTISANEGTYANGEWTGFAPSVTFTNGNSAAQARIQSIDIEYAQGTTTTLEIADMIILDNASATDIVFTSNKPGAVVTYSDYDEDVITIAEGKVTPVAIGNTTVKASIAAEAPYSSVSITFNVRVKSSTETVENVVILSQFGGGWIAMKHDFTAVAVDKATDGTILDLTCDEADITWVMTADGASAMFQQPGTNKYLALGSNHDLALVDDPTTWTLSDDGYYYKETGRTFLYQGASAIFKSYAAGNAGAAAQGGYSKYATFVEPVFANRADIRTAGITSGVWGTICPKKEVKYPAGASFFEISYVEYHSGVPYKVFYDEIAEGASLEAGHPYLFQADEESTAIKGIAVGDDATSAINDHGFKGVLENETISVVTADVENYRYYIVYNNEIRLCGEGQFLIRAERAYLDMSDPEVEKQYKAPINGRRRVALTNNAPQVATGMDELNASEAPVKVMIDGKFYILRGEKMYDATGKLVK